jgi:putative FmdB family regulatory protein
MPLYEYRCKKCGHRFERIVRSYLLADVKECPVCKGEVEQLISAPAVQFKGSGFYSTDYAKPAAKAGQNSGDGTAKPAADSTPESSSSPASDGRAAAKTETASPAGSADKGSSKPAS